MATEQQHQGRNVDKLASLAPPGEGATTKPGPNTKPRGALTSRPAGRAAAQTSSAKPKPRDLFKSDINIENVLQLLRLPTTKAIRIHGSRDVQNMLKEISKQQLDDLSSSTVPTVVLVSGSQENLRKCSTYVLGAWQDACSRCSGHMECSWFMSNQHFAISLKDINRMIAHHELPSGLC